MGTAPLLPPPPPTVLPPSAGALTSRRPLILTPSSICFRGVACPAAKLLARPLRYSIAARAAARSKGSSLPGADFVWVKGYPKGAESSTATSEWEDVGRGGTFSTSLSSSPLGLGLLTGVKCMGIVVVVVIVRTV